jgi:hypothetical protein
VSYVFEEKPPEEMEPGEAGLSIYPNPARANLSIKCPDCQLSKIRIVDALGRLISEEQLPDSEEAINEVSINRLPIGVYLISVFDEGQQEWMTEKIVKY